MTKYEFLGDLSRLLSDIPEEERKQALRYYEDYFADAGEEKEQDILKELGPPEEIARQIRSDYSDNILYREGQASSIIDPPQVWLDPDDPSQNVQDDDRADSSAEVWTSLHSDDRASSSHSPENEESWSSQDDRTDWAPFPHGHDSQRDGAGTGWEDPIDVPPKQPRHSKNNTALTFLLLILTSPIWIAAAAGVIGTAAGVISALLGILAAMVFGGGGSAIGGLFAFIGGLISCICGEAGDGLVSMGVGCILFSVGSAFCYLGISLCTRLFPWLWKRLRDGINWCSRKFNRKEQPT